LYAQTNKKNIIYYFIYKILISNAHGTFFEHTKHSIKLRINHWRHMYYFNDIFTTFLGLESGSCAIDYQSSEKKISDFIKIP